MTNSNELKSKIEKQKAEFLWNDLESEGLAEKAYLVDYELDLVEVAYAIVENNSRFVKSLIGDGLLYPPTKEEIDYFVDHGLLLNTIKLDSHTLIQLKARM